MPNFSQAYEKISSLPIFPFLSQISSTLKSSPSRFLILSAETAAGKSTALPISILENFQGKILMLEPRRLAVTAISDRLSSLIGEENGETIGYRIHLDSKISKSTRLEVITEAILIRQLQENSFLEDVNVIIMDEFHERSIYSDLILAFLKETMQIRDDLYVLVMSATINYRSLSNYLGSNSIPAPIMEIPGRLYPVHIKYRPNISVAKAIHDIVNNLTIDSSPNSILAFLPGLYEIKKTKKELENYLSIGDYNFEILILHSSIPISEQRKVLSMPNSSSIRIILSSAIAETSLTVPGVKFVVDSGLCRINKINLSLGMEHLVTEKASLFSAEQRAGRAGRITEGFCIRLWDKNEVRISENEPEILRADLTKFVLECSLWGSADINNYDWLTAPNKSSWLTALKLLEILDCIEVNENLSDKTQSIKITNKGKAVLKIGLHPRLACVAISGGVNEVLPFSEYCDSNQNIKESFIKDLSKKLNAVKTLLKEYNEKNYNIDPILAGFPDRLARLSHETNVNDDQGEYQFPSGRKAYLSRELLISQKISNYPKWIVAPEVDSGETIGKIYSFKVITEKDAENFLSIHKKTKVITEFSSSENYNNINNLSIIKKEITHFGELVLKEIKLQISSDDFALALCDLVSKKGLKILPIDSKIEDFLLRAEFFGNDRVKTLSNSSEIWLRPFVKSQKFNADDLYNALYWYLNGQEIDKNVPTSITLENGKKKKVKYEKIANNQIQPTLEIIIQQLFGCLKTPRILGKPILLKLLSPASRPLQITDDLEHFWENSWIEICKEMKARYPKHNWNYKIKE